MKLSQWARQQGIRYETAWRWYRDGQLPVQAEQTATSFGSRLYGRRFAKIRAKRALEAMQT